MINNCHNIHEGTTNPYGSRNKLPGKYIHTIWVDSSKGTDSKNFLVLVIYFENLGCVPCLNSLMDLSDSLQNNHNNIYDKNVMLLVARTQDAYVLQRRKIEAWCTANGLKFPLYLIPSDSLKQNLIKRTSAILMDPTGEVELCEPFPLSFEMKAHIIRRLCK